MKTLKLVKVNVYIIFSNFLAPGCRNLPFLLPPGFSKVQKATKEVQEVADEVKAL